MPMRPAVRRTHSAVLDLSAERFLDYQSPTDADLARLITDTDRVVQTVQQAAAAYATDGLEAARAWSEAAGATFDTIDQGLVVFDKLRFSDLSVSADNLAQFATSSRAILTAMADLATQASTVDRSGLAALQTAFASYTALNESLITAAAVPYGNLPSLPMPSALAGGGGMTTYITVQAAPGMDVMALAQQVARVIDQRTGARR
jgi:hypothetical protein